MQQMHFMVSFLKKKNQDKIEIQRKKIMMIRKQMKIIMKKKMKIKLKKIKKIKIIKKNKNLIKFQMK